MVWHKYPYKPMGSALDRNFRIDYNQTLKDIEEDMKMLGSAETEALNAADEAKAQAQFAQEQGDAAAQRIVELEQVDSVKFHERQNQFDALLADTTNNISNSFKKTRRANVASTKLLKSTLTFIDDDIHKNAYDILFKDFVKGRGIPFMFAAIKGRIGVFDSAITYEQFLEMKAHPLVQFGNHTVTHRNLSTLNNQEFEQEVKECEEFLLENGVFTSTLIPPFGAINQDQIDIAKRYVDSIVITGNGEDVGSLNDVSRGFLNTRKIVRIDLSKDIEKLKQMVRWAKDKNGWMIASTHCHYSQDPTQPQNFVPQKLHDLIDYANSLGVEIADFTTAYERFKNPIEFFEGGEVTVGLSASGYSKGLHQGFYFDGSSKPYASEPPSSFPLSSVIKHYFTNSDATTYGWPSGGTLLTSTGTSDSYAFQIFSKVSGIPSLMRSWNTVQNKWNDWVDINKTYSSSTTKTFNVGYTDIPAGSGKQETISSSIFKVGDSIIVNPTSSIPVGVMFNAFVTADGAAILSVYNGTGNTFNLSGTEWIYRIFRG